MLRRTSLAAALCLALLAVGCDSGAKPAPPTPPSQVSMPQAPGVQALTASQKAQIAKDFGAARELIERARTHKSEGEDAERAGGMQEAIPHYQEAIPLYREAQQLVEPWIEPDLEELTEAQVEAFMGGYVKEIGRWQHEKAAMGKVPPKSK